MISQAAAPPMSSAPPRPTQRTAVAVIVLFVLSPLTAEVLSGSTPILLFLTNPIGALYQIGFYGSGAVLVRELVRRRGLGWPNILILGMAYGILEEGLVVTSWFNPYWPDIQTYGSYGWAGGLNWVWALNLTLFHAIISITIPILLVESLFPRIAAQPWLGNISFRVVIGVLAATSIIGALLFSLVAFHKYGYVPPLLPYLAALALAGVLVWLGTHLRLPAAHHGRHAARPLPRLGLLDPLWTLRILGFVIMAVLILDEGLLHAILPFAATCAFIGAFVLFWAWRIWVWSRRPAWDARHTLAIASGLLGFFILFYAPLLEFAGSANGKPTHGTALVALGYLILLITLARFTAGRVASSRS
jgi:hypothetical protein